MGRHPVPKSEKEQRGTFRSDRDDTVTLETDSQKPELPESLKGLGLEFWHRAYSLPWITAGDQTQVLNVAQQLNRQAQLIQVFEKDPADFRVQRALKEIDRSIESGLDTLLLTPNARRRAGLELTPPIPKEPTKLEQLRRARDERDTERLQTLRDKSMDRIEALMG